MLIYSRFVSLILLIGAAACNAQQDRARVNADTAAGTAPGLTVTLPDHKADSVRVEGVWQPTMLILFKPAASIPFVTYVPSDMIAERSSDPSVEAYYFYTNFAGQRNDQAYLAVSFLPAGTTEAEAISRARAFKSERAASGFFVDAELMRHGDRYYIIGTHYPVEYGDGFGPRAARIREEWQWLEPVG